MTHSMPITPNKHLYATVINGQRLLTHRQKLGMLPTIDPPDTVIFCYHKPLAQQVKRRGKQVKGFFGDTFLFRHAGKWGRCVLVSNFGVGAPAVAVLMEDWTAFGVRRFISIGVAGGLQPDLATGDVVFCEQSLRDEGTSRHYVAPTRLSSASAELTTQLSNAWPHAKRHGISWTTDAPYRETQEEIAAYQAEGILTVEMESSALFAVGQYLGVQTAAMLVVGDRITLDGWSLTFDYKLVERTLKQLVEMVAT